MAFWVFEWFRDHQIETLSQIDTLVTERSQFRALQLAARENNIETMVSPSKQRTLVAGRGVDLTGIGACSKHRECVRLQVDRLLRKAWFYFDDIIVDDMTNNLATVPFEKMNVEAAAGWLEAVLYVQQIGAEQLVRFVHKNVYCSKCGREHAREIFHQDAPERLEEELVRIVESSSSLRILDVPTNKALANVRVTGPNISEVGYGFEKARTWLKGKSEAEIKRTIIEHAIADGLGQLYNDAKLAEEAQAPLGCATTIESFLMKFAASPNGNLADAVAFSLDLPYFEGVTVHDLLRLREHEGAAFEAFRNSLRLAIHERAKISESPQVEALAREIKEDVIEPKLSSLRVSLERNAETVRRSATGAVLSAFGGVVGLFVPGLQAPAATAGAAAIALTASTLNALKDRDSLKGNEMFLLLEAQSEH